MIDSKINNRFVVYIKQCFYPEHPTTSNEHAAFSVNCPRYGFNIFINMGNNYNMLS